MKSELRYNLIEEPQFLDKISPEPQFLDKISQENSIENLGERIRENIEREIVEKLKDIKIEE